MTATNIERTISVGAEAYLEHTHRMWENRMNNGISQNMFNSPGGSQQASEGDNIFQSSATSNSSNEKQISKEEIISLLNKVEEIIILKRVLKESDQNTVIRYLDQAKTEIDDKKPSRDILLGTLKKTSETLEEASKVSDSAKSLWKQISPHIGKIVAWASSVFI
ncbi:MAG: hypothetical protein F6K42_26860 [Leptolyngbya sp. SIO1D8]|nr:hypothetical protein [Leptolyngbya sp. SIO1D8]